MRDAGHEALGFALVGGGDLGLRGFEFRTFMVKGSAFRVGFDGSRVRLKLAGGRRGDEELRSQTLKKN